MASCNTLSRTHACKQIALLLILCLLVLCPAASAKPGLFPAARHGDGELRYLGDLPVAILQGTPAEMGEQHAALLAKAGAPLMRFPKRLFTDSGADKYWPLAVIASKRLLMQAPQRMQEEMDAAAKNSDVDVNEVGVANTLLELRRLGCSTLIVNPERSATGGPLFGRNFDFPPLGLLDKYSLLMIVRPEGHHAFASVGYPGLFGVISGMNDAGLAVATLDVYASANSSPKFEPLGVPQMLVYRQILEECSTVAEAEALLQRTKATTWANLAVCDRDGGAVFEITPTEVRRREAEDALLPCTNHFRCAGLACDTECWRYERLSQATAKQQLDISAVQQHLHAANQGFMTLHTMVFEPRELVLHLTMGTPPSSAHALQRIELGQLLSADRPQK